MGRKSNYPEKVEPRFIEIEGWCREGILDHDIARKLGVAYSTFREYRDKYPALAAILKKGKEVVDFEVENALLKRALGYEYEESKVFVDTVGKKTVEKIKKHMPPSEVACIYWLNNRCRDKWRNHRDNGNGDIPENGTFTELLDKLAESRGK